MSIDELVRSLIVDIQRQLPFEVRTASPDYLEGVLQRHDLPRFQALLTNTFGQPTKDFDQPPALPTETQRAIDEMGGIRQDQCLFLTISTNKPIAFAMLWPWASDPQRVTLKLGLYR